jgi:hypothetical protein
MHTRKKPIRIIISAGPGERELTPAGGHRGRLGAVAEQDPLSAALPLETPCSVGRHAFIQADTSNPERAPSTN